MHILTEQQTSTMVLYFINVNKTIKLDSEFKTGNLAVFQSAALDLTVPSGSGDNTSINILQGESYLLHISIRRDTNLIVFNSKAAGGSWDTEETVSLEGALTGPPTTVTVYDHGDRFQILGDFVTLHYFTKRIKGNADSFSYLANTDKALIFSNPLAVTTTTALAGLVSIGDS